MDRTEQVVILSGAAADQWGLVTAAQARKLGLNAVQLKRLTEAGLLENVGRGVYAMPAAGVPQHLEVKVAWLRLQPEVFAWERVIGDRDSGVVSHASACRLHGLGDIPAPEVEISAPRRRTTTEPFVRLRIAQMELADITVVDGLPVTTAARTIMDLLKAKADGGHVGGVIADAERRDLVDIDALAARAQPWARAYGLPANASGNELIEHLAGQAGRHLHSQDLIQAGREGFAAGAQLLGGQADSELLAPYIEADALAAQALEPIYRKLAEQRNALRETFAKAMPQLPVAELPSIDAFQKAVRQLQTSPAWIALLREVTSYPGSARASQVGALSAREILAASQAAQQLPPVPPGRTDESATDPAPGTDTRNRSDGAYRSE